MTFWLLTSAVVFGVFAAIAAIGSVAVGLAAPTVARRFESYTPAACAAALFRLRMLPGALAIAVAFAVVLPVFLAYEPRGTTERIPLLITVLAVAGAGLLVRGAWRAFTAWRTTRGVVREWRRRGRRLDTVDAPLPVFAIEEAFPTVAVVGVARPALFIAERVLRECPADEVRAMLHHECAHVAKRDNLKRFLMRACPDFVGAGLDRAWARAAEEAADAAVVAHNPRSSLELAQALIHVARLAPAPEAPALASAFYLGGSIESRVRRLVQPEPPQPGRDRAGRTIAIIAALLPGVAIAAAPTIHRVVETIVHALP
jgi:hypothetical protein